MELDELKEKWAEHDRKLDQSIRLNRQLMRETYTRRAKSALWRLAAVLALGSITLLAALNAQIGMALRIDYTQPVAAIQKRLETLRKFRIRYIQAILVSAALLWMPMFIVAMKGFFDADVYRLFATAWIVTNVAFGFAVLVLGIWLSKKYRPGAGYNLNAASGFLATVAEFEQDASYSSQERSSMRAYSPEE
jgi:hypothetical protein